MNILEKIDETVEKGIMVLFTILVKNILIDMWMILFLGWMKVTVGLILLIGSSLWLKVLKEKDLVIVI